MAIAIGSRSVHLILLGKSYPVGKSLDPTPMPMPRSPKTITRSTKAAASVEFPSIALVSGVLTKFSVGV